MIYIKSYKIFESIDRSEWNGIKIGDRVIQDSIRNMYPLPNSQVPTEDGVYQLQYIPIDKTNIYPDNRGVFDKDDYDGYQFDTLDYMTKNFDNLPPCIFKEESDGIYTHIDGHHRTIIAKEISRTHILSFIYLLNQLDRSNIVNSPPKPKFKKISEPYELNIYLEPEWVYFHKGKRVNKKEIYQKVHTGDIEIVRQKEIDYQ